MLSVNIVPETALETAVINKDNAEIVRLISEGAELLRPDVLATDAAFSLRFPVAVLLLECSSCLRCDSAVERLVGLGANPEMVDLVKELRLPLPENRDPHGSELVEALDNGDELEVANLICNELAAITSADISVFRHIGTFPKFVVEALFDEAVGERLKAQLFLHLRSEAEKNSAENTPEEKKAVLLFEVMKVIFTMGDTPERNQLIHKMWKERTMSVFAQLLLRNGSKISEECLAYAIMDQDIEFDIKPFKEFSPYYQAMMRNNAGVGLEQFDREAEIEKFDARAVFELLSGDDDYEDRVNWELVNHTAKASEFLQFLSRQPWYADKADWHMINVQADAEDWLDFLESQPTLLGRCRDHAPLYIIAPERWQKIFNASGGSDRDCFACLWRYEETDDWEELFKVSVKDGKAEFYDINDPASYEDFAKLASEDHPAFLRALQNGMDGSVFVNITR